MKRRGADGGEIITSTKRVCGRRRAVRVEHPVEEMFMLSILYMDRSMEDTELFMLKALGGFLKIRSYSR